MVQYLLLLWGELPAVNKWASGALACMRGRKIYHVTVDVASSFVLSMGSQFMLHPAASSLIILCLDNRKDFWSPFFSPLIIKWSKLRHYLKKQNKTEILKVTDIQFWSNPKDFSMPSIRIVLKVLCLGKVYIGVKRRKWDFIHQSISRTNCFRKKKGIIQESNLL